MLKDYLGLPEEVDGITLYPIKVLDWEEFSSEAYRFLPYGYDFLKFRLKASSEVKLFDFLVAIISDEIETSKSQNHTLLDGLEKMFSLITRQNVRGFVDTKNQEWWFELEDGGRITKHNYDSIRDIVMRQNLIFEPVVAPDELSQKMIDDAIAILNKKGSPSDLEAMICAVCNSKGISAKEMEHYTYYQLRADFEMSQRLDFSRAIHVYRAQGATVEPPNIADKLSIHENPYGRERLFRRSDRKDDEKLRQMMQN